MSDETDSYWSQVLRRPYRRRVLLRGVALGSAGLAGAAIVGCSSSNNSNGKRANAPSAAATQAGGARAGGTATAAVSAGSAAGTSPIAALVRRSASQPSGEAPVRGGAYTAASGGNPPTLDPHKTSSVTTMTSVSPVMSRLLAFKSVWDVNTSNNREVTPDLAQSVESPDGATWTVKLRADAAFHNVAPINGHPVEAEDIKVTFTRAVAPTSANRGNLSAIDPNQIQTPDKNTVIFKLNYPFAQFATLVASGIYGWIFPREIANDAYDPTKTIVGSGPFLFDSYTPDVAITYKRNANWYDKDRPYIDSIKYAIVPDPNQQAAQFTAGNLDVLGNIAQDNVPTLTKQNQNADLIANWGPGDGQMYFQWGEANSPMKDIRLRQALSLALDRNALAKVAFDGKAIPTFYAPQSFGKWALKLEQLPADTAQYYKADLGKAKQLADAAGASSLTIKMLSPTPFPPSGEAPWFKTMRETVYNMLQALPWKINLVLIDYNKDWVGGGKGVRYGSFDVNSIVFAGLEGRNDVDEYIFSWYDSQSTANVEHLKDDMLDSMISKGRTILNEDERVKAYLGIQRYMAGQLFSVAGNPNGLAYTMVAPRVRNYLIGDTYGVGIGTWANLWLKK